MIEISGVELASGLVGLGRKWPPTTLKSLPTDDEAQLFLGRAVQEGIRLFDTAPAYGSSEVRLGNFISGLLPNSPAYKRLIICTKVGEHWDPETGQSTVDHTFIGMKESLQKSQKVLGRVDVVLLHKSKPETIRGEEFNEFADYALRNGVENIGASISDLPSAEAALTNSVISVIQLPYNHGSPQFREVIESAQKLNKIVVVNRPFSSGEILTGYTADLADHARVEAFSLILDVLKKGFILTGTTNYHHLRDNINAFRQALLG